jgi:hypothetical protein
MPADPIGSAWAKYHWASKHVERVNEALERSFDPNANFVSTKYDIETTGDQATALLRVKDVPTARTDCGLALGDVLQNFRAALDHLAWGLVKVGDDPRPGRPRRVYFPMAESGASFRGQVDQWLPGVPAEYRAIIRRFQPYRRGDGPKAVRWLRNLSDRDKHRVLLPAALSHIGANIQVRSNWRLSSVERLMQGRRTLNVGTPLARVSLDRVGGEDCQVDVDGGFMLSPSLGYGIPVPILLGMIEETVLEILGIFDELI